MSTTATKDQSETLDNLYRNVQEGIAEYLVAGDEKTGLQPVPKENAQRASAGVMLCIMRWASLVWSITKKATMEVQLRPDVTAKLEFSGPVTAPDIERLKRHLDLMAEALPQK